MRIMKIDEKEEENAEEKIGLLQPLNRNRL